MTVKADAVDQVARDSAAKAISMIEMHERVCAERHREGETWRSMITGKLDNYFDTLNGTLGDLSDQVKKIYAQMWMAAILLITTMIGAIGFLIANRGL